MTPAEKARSMTQWEREKEKEWRAQGRLAADGRLKTDPDKNIRKHGLTPEEVKAIYR